MQFKYLNYTTIYSAKSDTINIKRGVYSCFADLRRKVDHVENLKVEIIVLKSEELVNKQYDNYCFLDKKDINNFINSVKFINPFTFKVVSGTYKIQNNDHPCYKITLFFKEIDKLPLLFILTWVRYLYEFPFNVEMLDLIRLRKEGLFRGFSNVNLMGIIQSYMSPYYGLHSIYNGMIVPFKNVRELKNRFSEVNSLNGIFEHQNFHEDSYLKEITDSEFWLSDKKYNKRKEVYLNVKKNGFTEDLCRRRNETLR